MTKEIIREIIFDVETTGKNPFDSDGKHRIVEIGAIEVVDFKPTGRVFHQYINPKRHIPKEVVKIHDIDNARIADAPTFKDIAQDWIDFIGDDSQLVAHNASFDMSFINAELGWAGFPEISSDRIFDTLKEARKQFPRQKNSLDALCKRFKIDNSGRKFHGALLDSELLLEVYIKLCGGEQYHLELADSTTRSSQSKSPQDISKKQYREPRPHSATDAEKKAHQAFLKKIFEEDVKNPIDPIWGKYKNTDTSEN